MVGSPASPKRTPKSPNRYVTSKFLLAEVAKDDSRCQKIRKILVEEYMHFLLVLNSSFSKTCLGTWMLKSRELLSTTSIIIGVRN